MANFFEDIYGLIVEPIKTLGRLTREEKPVGLALGFFLVAQLLTGLLSTGSGIDQLDYGALSQWGSLEQLDQVLSGLMAVMGLVVLVLSLIMLFVQAGLFSLLAELLGGQANGKGLLVGLAFSALPGLLIATLIAGINLLGFKGIGLEVISGLVLLGWTSFLQVLSIREGAAVTTGKAILIYLLPVAVLFTGVIAVVTALLVAVA